MAYATLDDLKQRFGETEIVQLTDRNGDDTADQAVVDRALEDASAIADSYLARRHTVPLDPAPLVLVSAVCDIARARLYDANVPEAVTSRKDEAIGWLKRVADGKADAITDPAGGAKDEPAAISTKSNGLRVFDRDSLRGFTG